MIFMRYISNVLTLVSAVFAVLIETKILVALVETYLRRNIYYKLVQKYKGLFGKKNIVRNNLSK